ncbi:hypothetical protein [Epilithonimonas sp. UC225_85]|uniref:hypothetical protein n=1 Tax=Epilithonimonas sp. UC225_85 TaxID=3350167 RepID=UPI0036D26CA2
MKISELKLNQEVLFKNKNFLYKGVQKITMPGFGKVQKVVFQSKDSKNVFHHMNLHEGNRTLKTDESGNLIL